MQQWLFPGKWTAITKNDLRIGGRYAHEMIDEGAGDCGNGEPGQAARYPHTGEYLEIKRPEKLVFTWSSPFVSNTRVTLDFRDLGDKTELTLTHEFLPNKEQFDSHTRGWIGCLSNLEERFSK